MKESQKRARLQIFRSGLERLLEYETLSHREFFHVNKETANENDNTLRGEILKKTWQKAVVERMVKQGLVHVFEENGQKLIRLVSKLQVKSLVETDEEYSPELAWYVFPKEVPEGEPVDGLEATTALIEDKHEAGEPEPTEEQYEQSALRSISGFIDVQTKILEAINGFSGLLKNVLPAKNHIEKLENGLSTVAKRIDSLKKVVEETRNLVGASHKMVKDHLGTLQDVESAAEALNGLENRIEERLVRVDKLTQSFDLFTEEYKKDRQDKLGDLIRKLKSHLEEGEVLHDLLVEAAADGNTGRSGSADDSVQAGTESIIGSKTS